MTTAKGIAAPYRDILSDLDAHDPVPPGEMQLDPGIRRYVLILRAEGIETIESCQGAGASDAAGHFRCDGGAHCFPEPTVRFHGNAYEGFRVYAIAMTFGLPVSNIRQVYRVIDGQLEGPQWEITFRTADPEAPLLQLGAVVAEMVAARA